MFGAAAKREAEAISPARALSSVPTCGPAPPRSREAQLLIRHPNYSGMQMDQVTRLYVPAISSSPCVSGRARICCSLSRAAFRFRKIRNSASTTAPMARQLPRRDGRQRRQVFQPGMAGDARLTHALRSSGPRPRPAPLRVAHDGVGGRAAELLAEVAAGRTAHAQHRLRLLVFFVGQNGGDHVDRARTPPQRVLSCRLRGHAGKHVFGAGSRGVAAALAAGFGCANRGPHNASSTPQLRRMVAIAAERRVSPIAARSYRHPGVDRARTRAQAHRPGAWRFAVSRRRRRREERRGALGSGI